MGLESVTYISDLVATNPVGATDPKSQGDDHIRNIKLGLLNTFPNITGAVTATQTELNFLDGVTGTTGAGKIVLDDAPTIADLTVTDSATLPDVDVLGALNVRGNVTSSGVTHWIPSNTLVLGSTSDVTVSLRGGGDGAAFQINQGTQVALIRAGGTGGANTVASFAADEIQFDVALFDMNGSADISGTLTVGGATTLTGGALLPQGSASAPVVARANDADTGLYFPSGNTVGLSAGDSLVASFSQSEIDLTATTLDFNGNTDISGTLSVGGAVTAGTAATSTSATLAAGQIHNRSANTTVNNLGAGRWVAVQNTSTSAITLSEGSGVTLELGGTTTTGNRTLGPKGFAFIYFRANNTATVQGSGVS